MLEIYTDLSNTHYVSTPTRPIPILTEAQSTPEETNILIPSIMVCPAFAGDEGAECRRMCAYNMPVSLNRGCVHVQYMYTCTVHVYLFMYMYNCICRTTTMQYVHVQEPSIKSSHRVKVLQSVLLSDEHTTVCTTVCNI